MMEATLAVLAILQIAVLVAVVVLFKRLPRGDVAAQLGSRIDGIERLQERADRSLREEFSRGREEETARARELREEVNQSLKALGDTVVKNMAEIAQIQRDQLQVFGKRLTDFEQANGSRMEAMRETMERRVDALRGVVDGRLKELRDGNEKKLDEMRRTVDEQLHGALEKRLGESFKLVSQRLEQVHRGLGEMQTLASGVGELKRMLTTVKVRGTWGEVQLGNLLDQILTPEQYLKNVAPKEGSRDHVEYVIRLPGQGDDEQGEVWMPIDAKFPQENYAKLIDAAAEGDAKAVEAAGRQLEQQIKLSGRTIRDKYLNPPRTTDFAVMFLPTEGLYAEVIRRAGLADFLQRECRVVVAGPTTLAALLNSLQVGFQTLAIQQRSSEVWSLLGSVKMEFQKFGEVLAKVRKKLTEATNTIDQAETRTRVIERKLKDVHELPVEEVVIAEPPRTRRAIKGPHKAMKQAVTDDQGQFWS